MNATNASNHDLVTGLEQSVITITGAVAVAMDIGPPETLLEEPVAATRVAGDALSDALHKMLSARRDNSGGVCRETHTTETGEEMVLTYMPLTEDKFHIGGLALAFAAARWDNSQSPQVCLEIARMVSRLVANNRARQALELDVVAMKRQVTKMAREAEIDPLTRVETKKSFENKAQAQLSNGLRKLALLVVDIDNFKNVNDLFGHQFGDRYLFSIAECLRSTFPRNTLIGRIGGDEFCILVEMASTSRQALENLIKQLRIGLQRNAAVLGKPELGRVSIGIGIHPVQARDYDALFSMADAALYESKRVGKNTATVYHPELAPFLSSRDFARNFEGALETGQIVAHFQPIIALDTGENAGLEVLARWQHPVHGFVMPHAFEPAFHDHRMAEALTLRIVNHALEEIASIPGGLAADGPPLWFNLTAFDLLNPEFVFEMQAALTQHGLDWERIVIEVTERAVLGERNGQVYRTLEEVRRRGARVAFDDFGTGNAGLLHIKDWPVDIIKIDRSFVEGIAGSARNRVLVEALLQIATNMGQSVVAEGIETREQLGVLREMGCRYGQGFLFSSAMLASDLENAPRQYAI